MSTHTFKNKGQRQSATTRPTSWWLNTLRRRAEKMHDEYVDTTTAIQFSGEKEQYAAVKFFNAAFRAEESGLRQAHELAEEVSTWSPDLGEVLRLYGDEEGWHRELITSFLHSIDGKILPMGRVTKTLYGLYARAERMETIVLANLMFETIGATTYRMALRNVEYPSARHMLKILTRDESFHIPLNVHFLRHVLERVQVAPLRLRFIFGLLFFSLTLLPLASRPKAQAFDRLGRYELSRAYVEQLAKVFLAEPDLRLEPPRLLLWFFGLKRRELLKMEGPAVASIEAAEAAADRRNVQVEAL
ncbi:MAG: ferritin-like domain-containing protein [Polyangiaceae bacterium]|nr:ferritin-like domain-containing protein [Polyangiaceae bacterium]